MQDLKLSYNVPIKEASSSNALDNFIIQGIAISATTTGNNHRFIVEELRSSAQSLKGVPLLVDHRNEVSSIKGRVTESSFDEVKENIPFAARVIDKEIQEMIKDGRINSVSVGAQVKELDEEDGVLIPKGITFKELSLVAVPADPNATFSTALQEAWSNDNTQLKGGQTIMNVKTQETVTPKIVEAIKEDVIETTETSEIESLREQLASYKAKERKHLEDSYKALCKQKNVKTLDTSGMSEASVNVLIEQVNSIVMADADETPEAKAEEPKPEAEAEEVEGEESVEGEEALEMGKYTIKQGRGSLRGGSYYIE